MAKLFVKLGDVVKKGDPLMAVEASEFVQGQTDLVSAAAPGVRQLVIDDRYEAALAVASTERPNNGRSSDDLYVLYTGGTTGMPKGVMWRHEDIFFAAMNSSRGNRPLANPDDLGAEIAALPAQMRLLALGPMMHGGGQWVMGNALMAGNVFVLWTGKRFDPHAIWRFVAAYPGWHAMDVTRLPRFVSRRWSSKA